MARELGLGLGHTHATQLGNLLDELGTLVVGHTLKVEDVVREVLTGGVLPASHTSSLIFLLSSLGARGL